MADHPLRFYETTHSGRRWSYWRFKKGKINSLSVYVDKAGVFAIFTTTSRQVCNAKTIIDTLMQQVLDEPRCQMIRKTFHPLDELDKERMESMETFDQFQRLKANALEDAKDEDAKDETNFEREMRGHWEDMV